MEKIHSIKSAPLRFALYAVIALAALIFLPITILWLLIKATNKYMSAGVPRRIILGVLWSGVAITGTGYAMTPFAPSKPQQEQEAKAEEKKVFEEDKEIVETKPIPFSTETRDDGNLAKGKSEVRQEGSEGTQTITWKVHYVDGKETSRVKASDTVAVAPVNKIIANGTYVAPPPVVPRSKCDPNYSGCVPIASDVDCAGGSGNGPAYTGPVRVIGTDIYDLDRDGDGYACE